MLLTEYDAADSGVSVEKSKNVNDDCDNVYENYY